MVTKIGPPKVSDTTSAKGKCLKPKKIQTKAIDPQIALKACRPGLVVLSSLIIFIREKKLKKEIVVPRS